MKEMNQKFSETFMNELIDLIGKCVDENTDGCTMTFEYPHAILECELNFKITKREDIE